MRTISLGKIDLYQWLFFLAMHSRRHLAQLAAAEADFLAAAQTPTQAMQHTAGHHGFPGS